MGTPAEGAPCDASELAPKLVDVEAGVAKDAAQRSALEFAVQRDDQEGPTVGMAQANVASSLSDDLPAKSLQRPNQLRAGDDGSAPLTPAAAACAG